MLTHPTLNKLQTLRLTGMIAAFQQQAQMPEIAELGFEERLGLLVDRELTDRENRRMQTRLKKANLRQTASFEDIDFQHARGLDKALMLQFATGQWLRSHSNILIVGPTGVGKTYLSCALAHKACLEGFSTLYFRLPRLFQELAIAKGDGRYASLLASFAKTDLLLLDDWGISPLSAEQRRDFLEILDDRHGTRSTMITSQFPVEHWHEIIGDPTLADAILDRIVHNAYKIILKGESMRKKQAELTRTSKSV